jgi:hypothetical protein
MVLTPNYSGYVAMGAELNKTGRPIVYACSWPAYMHWNHFESQINYTAIGEHCNLWRNYDDIERSWGSVMSKKKLEEGIM